MLREGLGVAVGRVGALGDELHLLAVAPELEPLADDPLRLVAVGGIQAVAALLKVVIEQGTGEGQVRLVEDHCPHHQAGDGFVEAGDVAIAHPVIRTPGQGPAGDGHRQRLGRFVVKDQADGPAPEIEGLHIAQGVGPGHAG